MNYFRVVENNKVKIFRSKSYNYNFDKKTGYFERWGLNKEHDPQFSPYGPELLDIEITDICYGPKGDGLVCPFCYKSNTPRGSYMTFEKYKRIFQKIPETLTQVAFGVDSQCRTNPDTFKIMEYTRKHGVIPNLTVANIDNEVADKISNFCGACAVSRYEDKDLCYDSVKKLTDRGMKQVNIHIMICQENINNIYETFKDYHNDPRLKNLNAIVLLSLKKKGRGKSFTPLTQEQFNSIVNYSFEYNIPIGFDSCSHHKFINSINDYINKELLEEYCEPCESFGMFSAYINTYGHYFPCSFAEGEDEWKNGIDLEKVSDFLKDVWFDKKLNRWRNYSLSLDRRCPIYEI